MTGAKDPDLAYFRYLDVFYGIMCVVCFVIGGLGNFASFLYFRNRRKDNSTIIYIVITFVDILISVLILPVGISYFAHRQPVVFQNDVFCNVWHFIWQTVSRLSVALVGILSITRTLCILLPLQVRISRRKLLISIVVTTLLQLFTQSIMLWFNGRGKYDKHYVDCSLIDIEQEYYYYHVIPMQLWYWLPFLPVTISCFISLYVLQRSKRLPIIAMSRASLRTESKHRKSMLVKTKDDATLTIILLTVLYIVFNVPLCISNILWTIQDTLKKNFFKFDEPKYYFNNYVYSLCAPLNALANPIVYFLRMKRLRTAVMGKLSKKMFALTSTQINHVRYDLGSNIMDVNHQAMVKRTSRSRMAHIDKSTSTLHTHNLRMKAENGELC